MATKADLRRYDLLQEYGCACCRIDGIHSFGDIHHIVTNGYRRLSGGNESTILLCPWHHRGVVPAGHTTGSATLQFGPSLANGSKLFAKIYGSQEDLLAKVNKALGFGVKEPA